MWKDKHILSFSCLGIQLTYPSFGFHVQRKRRNTFPFVCVGKTVTLDKQDKTSILSKTIENAADIQCMGERKKVSRAVEEKREFTQSGKTEASSTDATLL